MKADSSQLLLGLSGASSRPAHAPAHVSATTARAARFTGRTYRGAYVDGRAWTVSLVHDARGRRVATIESVESYDRPAKSAATEGL